MTGFDYPSCPKCRSNVDYACNCPDGRPTFPLVPYGSWAEDGSMEEAPPRLLTDDELDRQAEDAA